jgi:RIO-like serine/threonine protein kinase
MGTGGSRILNLPKGVHYESDIFFDADPTHEIVVIKKYKTDNECIRWLNQHLAQYYDPSKGLPVAQHEFAALKLLEPYGFVPKPLDLRPDSIVMEFAGTPVSPEAPIAIEVYLEHCQRIMDTFARLNFRHNDLLPSNVLVHEGKVKVIDFTLSEFGDIQTMRNLPNPDWARPGQDSNILMHMSRRAENRPGPLGRVLNLFSKLGFVSRGRKCAGN